MKRVTLIATAIVLAVLVGMTARVAAQNTVANERTIMTFSNTVEMPGVTLPAGTYVFRLADTPTRNVVQVLSGDEKDILGQWTFVQSERPQASEDTVVMFRETPEGTMPAIQYWYYPGERIGKEFIYPKDQAQKIANRTGQEVLSEDGRVAASVTSTDSKGQVTEWQRESDVKADASASSNTQANAEPADSTLRNAPAPAQPTAAAGSLTGNRGADAEPAPAPARQSVTADASAQSESRAVGTSGVAQAQPEATEARAQELPRTASPAPLAGLIGLFALVGAAGVRRFASVRG